MARTVSLLVESGAIEQGPHPSDARKTQLTITEDGRRVLLDERERRVDWLTLAIVRELGSDELPDLQEATELLARLAGSADSPNG
jgi:DNA-binding MarR family transcriptional regulator